MALSNAAAIQEFPLIVSGERLRSISPLGFIATKCVAFLDCGAGDYHASHDLEDLITVIDGRDKIIEEVAAGDPALSAYVGKTLVKLVGAEDSMEALPGHLPADSASQGRLPGLRRKLMGIAGFIG